MGRRLGYIIAGLVIMVFCLSGCGKSIQQQANDLVSSVAQKLSGDVTGEVGKRYATQWFDFTVKSITKADEFDGRKPPEGYQFYDVLITETGTFDGPSPMGTFDFYMDDPSFKNYNYPLDPWTKSMMPKEFELNRAETVEYHMIYQVPTDVTKLDLLYTEVDEQNNEGTTFRIHVQ